MRKWLIRGGLMSLLVSPAIARAGAPQAKPVAVKEDDASAAREPMPPGSPEWFLQVRAILERGADAAKQLSLQQKQNFLEDTSAELASIESEDIDQETRQIIAQDTDVTENQATFYYAEAQLEIDEHGGREGPKAKVFFLEYARYIVRQAIASSPAADKTGDVPAKDSSQEEPSDQEKQLLRDILQQGPEAAKRLSPEQREKLLGYAHRAIARLTRPDFMEERVQQGYLSEIKAALDQDVKDKKITQQEADASYAEDRIKIIRTLRRQERPIVQAWIRIRNVLQNAH